jgi:hypothetical protein
MLVQRGLLLHNITRRLVQARSELLSDVVFLVSTLMFLALVDMDAWPRHFLPSLLLWAGNVGFVQRQSGCVGVEVHGVFQERKR